MTSSTSAGPLSKYFEFSEQADLFFSWNKTLAKHIRDLRKLYADAKPRSAVFNPKVEGRRDEIVRKAQS